MHRLLRLHYGPYTVSTGRTPTVARKAPLAYFEGDLAALTAVTLESGGTAFQREEWTALCAIPPSTTMSYGAVARAPDHRPP